MSFDSRELSEYEGKPRELYWFMRGTQNWFYTSGADEIVFDSQTFVPVAGLKRTAIRVGGDRSRSQLNVTMPRDTEVAELFIGIPNTAPVWLSVYTIHDGEADYAISWQGRIRGVDFKGATATATLDSLIASLKKQSLRHLFQNQCNHFTFDANCTLLEEDYSHAATLLTVDDDIITADNAEAADYFTAGQVERDNGDRRFIVSDTKAGATHTITLLTPFEDMEAGEVVTLIGGVCRHTFATCPVGNQANYGGYPKVPRKNPFKSFK